MGFQQKRNFTAPEAAIFNLKIRRQPIIYENSSTATKAAKSAKLIGSFPWHQHGKQLLNSVKCEIPNFKMEPWQWWKVSSQDFLTFWFIFVNTSLKEQSSVCEILWNLFWILSNFIYLIHIIECTGAQSQQTHGFEKIRIENGLPHL